MASMASMAKYVHQRTGREQQKRQPVQAGHDVGAMLGE
jgi:hypothetical protein